MDDVFPILIELVEFHRAGCRTLLNEVRYLTCPPSQHIQIASKRFQRIPCQAIHRQVRKEVATYEVTLECHKVRAASIAVAKEVV